MSLTMSNISRTGLGKLTVNMKNGKKSTETIWTSRSQIATNISSILQTNGIGTEIINITFNGKNYGR